MPFVLYYEPVTFCNLRCPACPTGTGRLDRPKEKVKPDQFKMTIDALSDWVFRMYVYNWGEPLLHNNFSDLVRYATRKGISVYASTNLSMPLSELQCENIVKSGLYSLKISIDGASSETHAKYRRGSNLRVVHENIRKLVRIKKDLKSPTPKLKAIFLIFEHNENEVADFRRQMAEIGVDRCGVTTAWIPPEGEDISKPTNSEFCKEEYLNEKHRELVSEGHRLKPCTWLYYATVINPGGNISPCCSLLSERFDFGKLTSSNIAAETAKRFRTVWNGSKYKAARKLFSNDEAIEKWILNLRNRPSEGMVFSQLQSQTPLICMECYIPHTLKEKSKIIHQLHRKFDTHARRCFRAKNVPYSISATIKAMILACSRRLQ